MEGCRLTRELQTGILTGTPSTNNGRAILVEPCEPCCHTETARGKAHIWSNDLGKSPKVDYVAKPCALCKNMSDKVIVLIIGHNTADTFVVPWFKDACCSMYAAVGKYGHRLGKALGFGVAYDETTRTMLVTSK